MAKQQSRAELEAEVQELRAQLGQTTNTPITGSYKGKTFVAGHTKIRNASGEICDTQKVMDAAASGDKEACEILDRLIDLQYGYLIPAEEAEA